MKRSLANKQVWVFAAVFAMLAPRNSMADGGVVLLHKNEGPFSVTVFVSPAVARDDPTDVSVLVQSTTTAEVVLDAEVRLAVDPPAGLALVGSDPVCSVSP